MSELKVTKVPALMEDLGCGRDPVQQVRAGQQVEGQEIDMHFPVLAGDDIRKVDINYYVYAKLGELAYRYDPLATTGIPSDFGAGFWNISYLPAKGSQLADETDLEVAITTLQAEVAGQADAVALDKKVFSAKLVKTAGGWTVEDSNKVLAVVEETELGMTVPALKVTLDSVPVTLLSVQGFSDLAFDTKIEGNDLRVCLLRRLSGSTRLDIAESTLDQEWGTLVTTTLDSDGVVSIAHPLSTVTLLNQANKLYSQGSVSMHSAGFPLSAALASTPTSRLVQTLAPMEAYVGYNVGSDDFNVSTSAVGVTADKGGAAGTVVVTHANLRATPTVQAGDPSLLARFDASTTLTSIVTLQNFSGTAKTDYTVETAFYFTCPWLVPTKFTFNASVNFDFGYNVFPPTGFAVGDSLYIVGLLEA